MVFVLVSLQLNGSGRVTHQAREKSAGNLTPLFSFQAHFIIIIIMIIMMTPTGGDVAREPAARRRRHRHRVLYHHHHHHHGDDDDEDDDDDEEDEEEENEEERESKDVWSGWLEKKEKYILQKSGRRHGRLTNALRD